MQQEEQRREPEPDHLFKGTYIGDGALNTHLEEIDSDSQIFPGVRDYIGAFPFTMEYFGRVYPFYNGSKVSESVIYMIYESSYITFVKMFKLNHPDWSEYLNDECLQHFIDFIQSNPDPTEYHFELNDQDNECHMFYYHDLNRTPPTHEKPHFRAYEIEYSTDGNHGYYGENYAGSGYFRDVIGEEVPFGRQMGIWGRNGIRRFHLYNRIALVERHQGNGENLAFLPSIQLRLPDGTPFDISIDLSEEKNHVRFIENDNDDLFLFEESLQNERRERRLEKMRQLEAVLRQRQEDEELYQRHKEQKEREREKQRQHYEKEQQQQQQQQQQQREKMLQFQNRKSQEKIAKQTREKELFEKQMSRWANFNASAYIDHPATIEMAQKFSVPLDPFVYRNLPVPLALCHEYRNPAPILDDDDDE
jgi:DNA segregation ATPase FtsK/SpoIIIE-like protein